jgi:hypothetical protein
MLTTAGAKDEDSHLTSLWPRLRRGVLGADLLGSTRAW